MRKHREIYLPSIVYSNIRAVYPNKIHVTTHPGIVTVGVSLSYSRYHVLIYSVWCCYFLVILAYAFDVKHYKVEGKDAQGVGGKLEWNFGCHGSNKHS